MKSIKPELDGAMLSVGLSEEATKHYLSMLLPSEVAIIACINSPSNVTVSGDTLALTRLEGLLKLDNIFARRLKVENAYHSPHMQVIADDYLIAMGQLQILEPPSDSPTMFSSVTGTQVPAADLDAAYWVRNMVSPVQFVQAVGSLVPPNTGGRRRRRDMTVDTLLEIGPHGALQAPIKQTMTANGRVEEVTYLSVLSRGQDARDTIMDTASKLWTTGLPLAFQNMNSPTSNRRSAAILTDMPNYAWNHTNKYWHETSMSQSHRLNHIPRLDLLGKPVDDFNAHEAQWRNILRLSENPWIVEHKIQDAILYPAAGMLCAVLEACKQLVPKDKSAEGFQFRDIIIGHALVLDPSDKGVPITLHIRPRKIGTKGTDASWLEFTLYSQSKNPEYIEHCSGLIQIQYKPQDGSLGEHSEAAREWNTCKEDYAECQRNCTNSERKEEFYAKWASRGMQYGPLFQPITKINTSDGAACCELTVTDTKSKMPAQFEYEHLIHPTTLDGIFQTFVAGATDCTQGMVPTAIGSMYVAASLPAGAGSTLRGFSKVTRKGFRNFVGPIFMSDETWTEPKIVVKGIFCTELGALSGESDSADQSNFVKKLCSQIVWKEDVDQIAQKNAQAFLSSEISHPTFTTATTADLEKAAKFYMNRALANLSAEDEATVVPHLAHFHQWMRHRVLLENTSSQILEPLDNDDFLRGIANKGIDGSLLSLVGANLPDIIKGVASPTFFTARDKLLSEYQTHALGLERAKEAALKWLDLQAHKRPDFEYLEISADNSGLAALALEVLAGKKGQLTPRLQQYTFTTADANSLEAVQKALKPWHDRVKCKKLDIQEDPSNQGFESSTFDVIIAHNVLHTTKNVGTTLAHCHYLLKPGGKLLLTEFTKDSDHLGLTMGTFPSWWQAEDGRVGSPLLDDNQWRSHLSAQFSGVDVVVKDMSDSGSHSASMMISTKPPPSKTLPFSKIVLLVPADLSSDGSIVVENLQQHLQACGLQSEKATLEQAATIVIEGDILVSGKAIISLLEVETSMIHDIGEKEFENLHAILLKGQGGLWISHASVQMDPACEPQYCAATGFMRTLRTEKPEIRMHQFDLSAQASISQTHIAELITQVFTTEFKADFLNAETEIAEREGRTFIPRLYDDKAKNHSLHLRGRKPSPELQRFVQPGRPLRLDVGVPGMLDSLHFVDDPRPFAPLGEHEIEFSVQASAVNFM